MFNHRAFNGEKSNSDNGTVTLVIPNELFKRIDPSFCSKKTEITKEVKRVLLPEEHSNRREELDSNMQEDEDSTDMDMQSEQGGEFSS